MFESFNWPLPWFLVAVVISIIVIKYRPSVGVALLALVGYLGVHWNMWDYVNVVFWFFWIIGLISVIAWYATYHPWSVQPARWGSRVALGIVLVMVLISVLAGLFGVVTGSRKGIDFDGLNKSIQSQLDKTNADVKALRGSLDSSNTAQKTVDDAQNARLDKLEKAVADLQKHDASQDKALADLKANIKQIKTTGVNMTPSPSDLTTPEVAKALAKELSAVGWKAGEVRVGTVDWSANPFEAGSRAFHSRITTRQELAAFLNGSSAQSKAARQHMLAAVPKSEHKRLLSGEGFVPVQFMKEICYSGNGYFLNGMFMRDGKTCRAAGDIIWVYVDSNGHVIWDASVRADCVNPSFLGAPTPHRNRPASTPTTRSTTPSKPPTTRPTTPRTHTTTTSTPVCSKKPKPGFKVNSKCEYYKPPQSKNCMLNGGPGCPPNQATQPVQHNSGQPTGRTTGAPTSAPPTPSSSTTAPGGSSGTSTGTPTGTSTCNPAVGCGTTHTSPPPTNIP